MVVVLSVICWSAFSRFAFSDEMYALMLIGSPTPPFHEKCSITPTHGTEPSVGTTPV